MDYKIIKLGNGRYFQTFGADNFLRSTPDPLEATKYTPKDVWHEEKALNADIDKLDKEGKKYTIMILSYEVREF